MRASARFAAMLGKPAPVFTPEFEAEYRAWMDAADRDLAELIARRNRSAA